VVEIRLPDFRRETDDGETGVQQDFCDVGSEAAGGAGDEGSFCRHGLDLLARTHDKRRVTGLVLKLIEPRICWADTMPLLQKTQRSQLIAWMEFDPWGYNSSRCNLS